MEHDDEEVQVNYDNDLIYLIVDVPFPSSLSLSCMCIFFQSVGFGSLSIIHNEETSWSCSPEKRLVRNGYHGHDHYHVHHHYHDP